MYFKLILSTILILNSSLLVFNLDNSADFYRLVSEINNDPTYTADFENHLQYVQSIEPNYFEYSPFDNKTYKFNCDTTTPHSTPQSVHQLRPGDIDVVASLGDSLTAALGGGAKTIIGLLREYRERSWSMGGKDNLEKVTTMPNILRKFNSKLAGMSTYSTIMFLNKDGEGFNAAVSGQEANHLVDQAKILVARLKADKTFDYKKVWKMITVFIGGNDLCDFCKDKALHSPTQYIKDIESALDIFKAELPRTFVNLVTVLRVNEVKNLNKGLVCTLLHKLTCPCAAFPSSAQEEQELINYMNQYQDKTEHLVASGKYDTSDDFTVVVQPIFRDFSLPRLPNNNIDFSFFAPDCFHLSPKGQAIASIGLWNNMLQPIGKKETKMTDNVPEILCPTTQQPYLFTNKNSF